MIVIPQIQGNVHTLPAHMQGLVLDYIYKGQNPGGFLEALVSNDLREAFLQADDINRMSIEAYVRFLYSYAPALCWGSYQAVQDWVEVGGIEGMEYVRTGAHQMNTTDKEE